MLANPLEFNFVEIKLADFSFNDIISARRPLAIMPSSVSPLVQFYSKVLQIKSKSNFMKSVAELVFYNDFNS